MMLADEDLLLLRDIFVHIRNNREMSSITDQDRSLMVEMFTRMLREHRVVVTVVYDHPELRLPVDVLTKLKSSTTKTLTLHYGLNLPIPIDDLRAEKTGIFATLSFNRVPFNTFVPWEAVIGFYSEGSNTSSDSELKKPSSKVKLTLVP